MGPVPRGTAAGTEIPMGGPLSEAHLAFAGEWSEPAGAARAAALLI
jgi:hypothetical protein